MRAQIWMTMGVAAAFALGAGFGRALAARPALAADAGRAAWEYRQVPYYGDYAKLEAALMAAGADGFELVLVSPQETVAVLKRRTE